MRVIVLYEDSQEAAIANNLAQVLANLAPTLSKAVVDKHGGVTQTWHHDAVLPKVEVQSRSFWDVFTHEIDTKKAFAWGGQMVRASLDVVERPLKPAWADIPALIEYLSVTYGVDPELVENLVRFADSASTR